LARRRKGRDINGVLVLNKPLDISSNGALQIVKRLFGAAKAGHTGSLDPLATGVLPLCFGEATKFSQFLLAADKAYRVTGKLGVKTASGDTDGDIIRRCPVEGITEDKLLNVLAQFIGETQQIPSMYSALKHKGQPLYKLARQGVEVERKPRTIHLYELTLLDFDGDEFSLDVRCSKGTYIRNLVEDIGEALGNCAHVIKLERTASGPYDLSQTVTLEQLDKVLEQGGHAGLDELLFPSETAVVHWPKVILSEDAAFYLQNGQSVQVPGSPLDGWVQILTESDTFLGVGEMLDDGKVAPRRLMKTSQEENNKVIL